MRAWCGSRAGQGPAADRGGAGGDPRGSRPGTGHRRRPCRLADDAGVTPPRPVIRRPRTARMDCTPSGVQMHHPAAQRLRHQRRSHCAGSLRGRAGRRVAGATGPQVRERRLRLVAGHVRGEDAPISAGRPARTAARPARGVPTRAQVQVADPAASSAADSAPLAKPGRRLFASARTSTSVATLAPFSTAISLSGVVPS